MRAVPLCTHDCVANTTAINSWLSELLALHQNHLKIPILSSLFFNIFLLRFAKLQATFWAVKTHVFISIFWSSFLWLPLCQNTLKSLFFQANFLAFFYTVPLNCQSLFNQSKMHVRFVGLFFFDWHLLTKYLKSPMFQTYFLNTFIHRLVKLLATF